MNYNYTFDQGQWCRLDDDGNPIPVILDEAKDWESYYAPPLELVNPICDCGAEKVKTNHVSWCSTQPRKL